MRQMLRFKTASAGSSLERHSVMLCSWISWFSESCGECWGLDVLYELVDDVFDAMFRSRDALCIAFLAPGALMLNAHSWTLPMWPGRHNG
jgi:hypothetical protein